MRFAHCTLDNVTYDARVFDQIVDFALINNHMVCTVCGAQATFRRQGSDNRRSCFKANHAEGCTQERIHANSATVTPVTAPVAEIIAVPDPAPACIVVDFRLDLMIERTELQRAAIQRAQAIYQRTIVLPLRALHGELIVNDNLLRSQKIIVVPGMEDCPVTDTFVNFTDITDEHIGSYHGFWGRISNANTKGTALWFNSGDEHCVSVCLDQRFHNDLYERFPSNNLNIFNGSNMLVFGRLTQSERGKKIIVINHTCHYTLRLY